MGSSWLFVRAVEFRCARGTTIAGVDGATGTETESAHIEIPFEPFKILGCRYRWSYFQLKLLFDSSLLSFVFQMVVEGCSH